MFAPEYSTPADEIDYLCARAHDDPDPDDRLRILVYVDGRLVDSWAGSVRYSRWADVAATHDRERRPEPWPPPEPPHVGVLRWLDGVVGGREALLGLDDRPTAPPAPPAIEDDGLRSAYESVVDHLDRVSAELFDEEVQRVLLAALAALWERAPEKVVRRPANEVAGGLVWVVGRANDLFRGGLRQITVQRELWMRGQLSVVGQGLASSLRGVDLYGAPRPYRCPGLMSFGNPVLLTAGTRRQLVHWRDEALRAEEGPSQS